VQYNPSFLGMAYLTLLIIYQLKPLYNNHSHNHRNYEGLSSINIKDFLRQDKKFIMIEYKHYDQFSQLYNHHAYRKSQIKIQLNHCYLEKATSTPYYEFCRSLWCWDGLLPCSSPLQLVKPPRRIFYLKLSTHSLEA
jgi:hypothetical protein